MACAMMRILSIIFSSENHSSGMWQVSTSPGKQGPVSYTHLDVYKRQALAGRQIVCGTGSYLYFHGINYEQAALDERQMLENPSQNLDLFAQYGVCLLYTSRCV